MEFLERRTLFAGIPILHSFAEARTKIFLDFDGHITTGTPWNVALSAIHSPPFDADGNPDVLSDDERSIIIAIWERMAEDFRPFDVDVTTEDPSFSDSRIFIDGGRAQRVVFTSKFDAGPGGTGGRWFHDDSMGVASESWFTPQDVPAWVFSTHSLAGEIGSHEVGHTIGLSHDSARGVDGQWIEYRGEHGSGETRWSPIMGQGNGLTQWSNGDYPNATNPEQDLGLLAAALGRRTDDYQGITPLVAMAPDNTMNPTQSINIEGIISHRSDIDIFAFDITLPNTQVHLKIVPWHNGPNLDIGVSLNGPAGETIISRNNATVNPPERLGSIVDVNLQPGRYYLQIDGIGKLPTPNDPGYTDYGSLGYYHITGAIWLGSVASVPGDLNCDGQADASDIDVLFAEIARDRSDRETGHFPDAHSNESTQCDHGHDLSGDGLLTEADIEVLVHEILGIEFGDFNLDHHVDFADYLILSANYQAGAVGWRGGDATGDRYVGPEDLHVLRSRYGINANSLELHDTHTISP